MTSAAWRSTPTFVGGSGLSPCSRSMTPWSSGFEKGGAARDRSPSPQHELEAPARAAREIEATLAMLAESIETQDQQRIEDMVERLRDSLDSLKDCAAAGENPEVRALLQQMKSTFGRSSRGDREYDSIPEPSPTPSHRSSKRNGFDNSEMKHAHSPIKRASLAKSSSQPSLTRSVELDVTNLADGKRRHRKSQHRSPLLATTLDPALLRPAALAAVSIAAEPAPWDGSQSQRVMSSRSMSCGDLRSSLDSGSRRPRQRGIVTAEK